MLGGHGRRCHGAAGIVAASTLLAVLAAAPAVLAARPVPGGQYSVCSSSRCNVTFRITRDGRRVSGFFADLRAGRAPSGVACASADAARSASMAGAGR
jgi:hypothetical protein